MPKKRKKAVTEDINQQTVSDPITVDQNQNTVPLSQITLSPRERQERQENLATMRRQQEENTDIINKFFLASKNGDVMEAEVMGVLPEGNEVYWLCHYGPITIRIPFMETFEVLPPALVNDTLPNVTLRRRQLLAKSVGLTIGFVITSFEPDPKNKDRAIVYGSRKKAMAKIRQRYFGPDAYNPVHVGDRVSAQILSVAEHAVWLNIRGMDIRVSAAELSHRYLPDLKEKFSTGQTITVEITRLDMNSKTGMPEVRASLRPIELEDAKTRYALAPVRSQYVATVTNKKLVNDRKEQAPRLRINLWINGIDIPAFSMSLNDVTTKDSIFTGDHLFVEILGYTDYGYCHCKILRKAGRAI